MFQPMLLIDVTHKKLVRYLNRSTPMGTLSVYQLNPAECMATVAPIKSTNQPKTHGTETSVSHRFLATPLTLDKSSSSGNAQDSETPDMLSMSPSLEATLTELFATGIDANSPAMSINYKLDCTPQREIDKELAVMQSCAAFTALLGIVRCFQTCIRPNRPFPVAVSETLPHILLLIGKLIESVPSFRHQPKLSAVLDSGAGVSLGYLPYFTDLNDKHPELVRQLVPITPENYSEIFVGNIDKDCEAAKCTHFIELFTPSNRFRWICAH